MNSKQLKAVFRVVLALFFILAGVMHFMWTPFYMSIVPPALSYPRAVVEVSGVCEILGGVGLLIPGLRRLSGYWLILLLVVVFPANVYMLMKSFHQDAFSLATVLLIIRLPLQFVFMHIVNVLSRYP